MWITLEKTHTHWRTHSPVCHSQTSPLRLWMKACPITPGCSLNIADMPTPWQMRIGVASKRNQHHSLSTSRLVITPYQISSHSTQLHIVPHHRTIPPFNTVFIDPSAHPDTQTHTEWCTKTSIRRHALSPSFTVILYVDILYCIWFLLNPLSWHGRSYYLSSPLLWTFIIGKSLLSCDQCVRSTLMTGHDWSPGALIEMRLGCSDAF